MPNPIEAQLKNRIDSFVSELDLLVRKSALEALRGVLATRITSPRAAARRPGRQAVVRPAATASTEGLDARIRAQVAQNPGQTVSQIASALGTKSSALKTAIADMLAGKAIRKAGQRRGTRYYPPGAGRLPATSAGRRKSAKARRKRGGRPRRAKAA